MIPIFEQGSGHGIGYGLESFLSRFSEICREHNEMKRAKAFAFIFYDFQDEALRKILKDQGVFAQLDRLSSRDLSIFFLHTGSSEAVEHFNQSFLSELGVQERVRPPCVVFFKMRNDTAEDIEAYELQDNSLIHGFHELYTVVDNYVKGGITDRAKYLTLFRASARFLTTQAFSGLLGAAIGKWI